VYQKTKAFFTKKVSGQHLNEKYFFLGAEEKVKKSNKI
jgi:hypothetical protein